LFLPLQAQQAQHESIAALIWTTVILAAVTAIATAILVGYFRRLLLRHDILDRPNTRSSHDTPTPRGGGIGVMLVLLPVWLIAGFVLPFDGSATAKWLIPAAAAGLAAISWVDDVRTIGALPRLGAQFAAAILGVLMVPGLVFQGLFPGWLDAAVALIGLVWFINLFNFMDGIDGISGVEAGAIGIGLGAVGWLLAATPDTYAAQAIFVAASVLGFLVWNWHPARIFLGDIGSIPLGFLLGWLLLVMATSGQWAAALILPLYYLVDATLTLLRRLLRGEKVWQAHREHFYQRAVQNGRNHAQVSIAVGLTNAGLLALAILSSTVFSGGAGPFAMVAAAFFLVAVLLAWMARGRALSESA
tara:strand:+ start:1022 stop:2098 length:1077 start_codon:yes stop_codon:yes gene_type:complete